MINLFNEAEVGKNGYPQKSYRFYPFYMELQNLFKASKLVSKLSFKSMSFILFFLICQSVIFSKADSLGGLSPLGLFEQNQLNDGEFSKQHHLQIHPNSENNMNLQEALNHNNNFLGLNTFNDAFKRRHSRSQSKKIMVANNLPPATTDGILNVDTTSVQDRITGHSNIWVNKNKKESKNKKI